MFRNNGAKYVQLNNWNKFGVEDRQSKGIQTVRERSKDKRLYNLLDEYNHKKMDDDIKALIDKNGKIQTTDAGIRILN